MENMGLFSRQRCGFQMGFRKRFFRSTGDISQTNRATSQIFSLYLARDGEWVRIVAVQGGNGLQDRLTALGMGIGKEIQVLRNLMEGCGGGKMLIGCDDSRLYLGCGMAHKIQVSAVGGEYE